MSRLIGNLLDDDRYCIFPSALCDCEVLNRPPRDLHKSITLCAIYGLPFHTLVKCVGIAIPEAGEDPMPDRFLDSTSYVDNPRVRQESGKAARGGFLQHLLESCEEVPFFLRGAIEPFSNLSRLSLDDFLWIGGEQNVLQPYLAGGLLALVNRRRKAAFHFASKPLWQQPIYVILQRDGTYLCACCSIENGSLVMHTHPQDSHRPVLFRNHQDAEVIGQVVTVTRKLL